MSAVLAEVADVLAAYGLQRCQPDVELDEDGVLCLTVRVQADRGHVGGALDILEMYHELRYVTDMAQMRALADQYDIPADQLERLLPKRKERGDGEDGAGPGG